MSRRRKAIAKLDRERRAAEQQREAEQLLARAKELKSRTGGFARTERTPELVRKLKKQVQQEQIEAKFGPRYQPEVAFGTARPTHQRAPVRKTVKYSGELALRQQAALQRTEELKARVGPVGNKMGDQYLTDSDLADMRKGLLRRRP